MSLQRYLVDFSTLSDNDKDALISKIDNSSFNGLHYREFGKSAEFMLEENVSIDSLHIPSQCVVTRLC